MCLAAWRRKTNLIYSTYFIGFRVGPAELRFVKSFQNMALHSLCGGPQPAGGWQGLPAGHYNQGPQRYSVRAWCCLSRRFWSRLTADIR